MKNLISTLVLLSAMMLMQAQEIKPGNCFFDGVMLYQATEITPDGTVIFAGSTYDSQSGQADGVDELRLKQTGAEGRYELIGNGGPATPFRCKWGAEVQYVRQQGMNFLAVRNSRGETVEVLVLTPDNVRNCTAQQEQMEKDVLADFNTASDAMLLNTHMLVIADLGSLQAAYTRLSEQQNPDIIQKTNCQMIQSEIAYRNGEAEGGYDPMDGSGPDMSFPVQFSGERPTISDFITAITSQDELCESMNHLVYNWKNRRLGRPIAEGSTLNLDERNGYCRFEHAFSPTEMSYVEFCYWNCKDGKHKLVAQNTGYLEGSTPVETECTGIQFYLYDNETHRLTYASDYDLGASIRVTPVVTYSLPRQGKDIQARIHDPKRIVKILMRWNGQKFDQEQIE